jgi:hypothetical protein
VPEKLALSPDQLYGSGPAASGKAKSACNVRHATARAVLARYVQGGQKSRRVEFRDDARRDNQARAVRRRVPPPPSPVRGSGSVGSRVASVTRAISSSDGSATRGDPSRTKTRFTVMAVDKAPPDAAISAMPGVSCRQEGAFGLAPRQEVPVDWLFSDIIRCPDRSLGLGRRATSSARCDSRARPFMPRPQNSKRFQGLVCFAATKTSAN